MTIRVRTAWLLFFGFSAQAAAQTDLQLLATYQGRRQVNPQGTFYSSVWGYTDAGGREYAILGCYNGTAIIDLNSLPALPEVAFIPGPPATYSYREFKTYLHFLYIVSEGGGGVQIVDLSGLPNSVQVLPSYTTPVFDRAHTISETAGYLYVNGGNATIGGSDIGGTMILSLANPRAPFRVGSFGNHYVHDSYTRNDTLFASGIFGTGLTILDVRNKSAPQVLFTITYPGLGTHNAWTTDDGRYVMTTDEIGNTAKTLKIWDIRNLQSVGLAAEWDPRPQETIHNVVVKGNFAYCAYYKAGLLIADISDITNPQLAAEYDTFPDSTFAVFNGAWGVYPHLPSGLILVSDMTYGLFVFQFNGQTIGRVTGVITDEQTGLPVTDAVIRIKETGQTRWTNASGEFFWGYASGSYEAMILRPGIAPVPYAISVPVNADTTLMIQVPAPPPPSRFELLQNYPNPFNASTSIPVDLPVAGKISVLVFDMLGQMVLKVVEGVYPAGRSVIGLDARSLVSGMYVYRVEAGNQTLSRKMILVR